MPEEKTSERGLIIQGIKSQSAPSFTRAKIKSRSGIKVNLSRPTTILG